MALIHTVVTLRPSGNQMLLQKTLRSCGICDCTIFFILKLMALLNAVFVECFYTSRTVAYMSHQSVSEPSFPRLRKIMSGGTQGLLSG